MRMRTLTACIFVALLVSFITNGMMLTVCSLIVSHAPVTWIIFPFDMQGAYSITTSVCFVHRWHKSDLGHVYKVKISAANHTEHCARAQPHKYLLFSNSKNFLNIKMILRCWLVVYLATAVLADDSATNKEKVKPWSLCATQQWYSRIFFFLPWFIPSHIFPSIFFFLDFSARTWSSENSLWIIPLGKFLQSLILQRFIFRGRTDFPRTFFQTLLFPNVIHPTPEIQQFLYW